MIRLFHSAWWGRKARGTSRRRGCPLRLEELENRFAPAVVSWVGAGDGVNWSDPRNWSSGALPTAADDVLIATDPGVTIRHTGGNDEVHSLQSQNALNLSGGSLTLDSDSVVNNTLTLSGALGTLTANGELDLFDLVQTNGTFTGTGTVTVSDQWIWTSGKMTGGGDTVLLSSAEAELSGSFFSMLDNRQVDNYGSVFLADHDGIDFANSTVWNNQSGSLFVLGDSSSVGNFFANSSQFNNQGEAALWNSSGTATISVPFTNAGAVDVESGTLSLTGGGVSTGNFTLAAGAALTIASNYTFQPGTTVTGPGTVQVPIFNSLSVETNLALTSLSLSGGTVTADGNLTLRDLTENNGTLTGDGTVTINDQWTWTSGTMSGNGLTVLNGTASLTGGFFSMLDNRTVDNRGYAVAFGTGFDFRDNAVWNNQSRGTFVLQDATDLGNFFAGPNSGFFNSGTLLVQGNGQATIDVPLTNNGFLSIGSTSTLRVSGDFTQGPFGTLEIDVGGTAAGAGYGQLSVGGTANLGGSLLVNLVNGFTPSPGDRYQILTFGSRGSPPSDFSAIYLPDGLTPVYDSHSLTLVADESTGP